MRSILVLAMHLFLSTPSARRATSGCCRTAAAKQFLSTPSARRATCTPWHPSFGDGYFYPRPPRGGRPDLQEVIRALVKFLSTPSARRATAATCTMRFYISISIHALREEGDVQLCGQVIYLGLFLSTPSARRATHLPFLHYITLTYFYPRPPRGGRQLRGMTLSEFSRFLSTPSARRATQPSQLGVQVKDISIHALREEGDLPSMDRRIL